MKVECIREKLKHGLELAERATGKKLSLPVLEYVLLLATDGKIKLRATNLDLGVEIEVSAKVSAEGIVAVPGGVLLGILNNLQDEKHVTLELVNENLSVTSSKHSMVVKCAPYEDFPTLPVVTKGEQFSINSKQFTQALRSVIFSASLNEAKPEFASVYFSYDGTNLVLVATDTSRLSEKRIPLRGGVDMHLLLPIRNATEILRICADYQGDIGVCYTKNQITLQFDGVTVTSRLIDGSFPDYRQIIPKQYTTEITMLRDDLANALKLTAVFSGKLQQVHVRIDPQEGVCAVTAKEDRIGESTTLIPGKITGDPIQALFNVKFVLDVLQQFSSEHVVLRFGGPGRPLAIQSPSDQSYLYLVMPMRNAA